MKRIAVIELRSAKADIRDSDMLHAIAELNGARHTGKNEPKANDRAQWIYITAVSAAHAATRGQQRER